MLNRLVRERLEAAFPLCWVAGEVSNLSRAASGHVYFSLKDAAAQVRCVMFRSRAQAARLASWKMASISKHEYWSRCTRRAATFNSMSRRHAAAASATSTNSSCASRKSSQPKGSSPAPANAPLPPFPRCVGVVTSLQAAALRDVLTTLARRAPQVSVVLYPTPVQGEGAGAQIADAIRRAGERRDCDLLIVCRGGGSMEDLWAFNDERVARAIRACPLPVICGSRPRN
ncbi:MAG: exodeoxyribonuclease VII large subunit [Candidatus Accumulibacter meliphilus]|jgi:exodeoxyribonuclease VII large subunit|uniref:exodeoxyribonuclease VII large subunit n=1 Tax=Candidatus Accumulibacter meliphilus TaxID=2211374 RepID=UPI002FC29B33